MLNTSLIRDQILVISEPGPLAGAVVKNVIAEAERYAQERVSRARPQAGTLDLSPVREAREILAGLVRSEGGGA